MWGYDGLASSVNSLLHHPATYKIADLPRSFSQLPNSDKITAPSSMVNSLSLQSGSLASEARVSSVFSSAELGQAISPSDGEDSCACSYPTVRSQIPSFFSPRF